MKRWFAAAALMGAAVMGVAQAAHPMGRYAEEDQPLPAEVAFRSSLMTGRNGAILVRWDMPPGYYLYRNKVRVEASNGMRLRKVLVPNGLRVSDPFLGDVEIYRDTATLVVEREPGAGGVLKVAFQGCQADRICYPPMTRAFTIPAKTCAAGTRIEAGAC